MSRRERVAEYERTSEERLVFTVNRSRPKFGRMAFFFIILFLFCPMVMPSDCREVMPNGHSFSVQCLRFDGWRTEMAEWPSSLVFMCRCRVSLFFVAFVVLSGSLLAVYIVFYYLLMHPVSLNLQQNSQRGQSVTRAVYCSV